MHCLRASEQSRVLRPCSSLSYLIVKNAKAYLIPYLSTTRETVSAVAYAPLIAANLVNQACIRGRVHVGLKNSERKKKKSRTDVRNRMQISRCPTTSHFRVACRRSRIPVRATVICFTHYRVSELIIAEEGNRKRTGGPVRGRGSGRRRRRRR